MADNTLRPTSGGYTPGVWWADPLFTRELQRQLDEPSPSDRDGGPVDLGYKPRPPDDPRWLKIATAVCLIITIAAFVIVVFHPQ